MQLCVLLTMFMLAAPLFGGYMQGSQSRDPRQDRGWRIVTWIVRSNQIHKLTYMRISSCMCIKKKYMYVYTHTDTHKI